MTTAFQPSPDAVDPQSVPTRTLFTGAQVPGIGIGTFGSDHITGQEVAAAVAGALRAGYRFVDCAACYGNEHLIGETLAGAIEAGLPREELFVVSKVWNDSHQPEQVLAACLQSLKDLRLDYLDCYLVHWPFPNYHEPFASPDARNPRSRPYVHAQYLRTWRAMENLVDRGLVRHIGTSNMTVTKLDLLLADARVRPAINEMELHPSFQQDELFHYCLEHAIQPVGFSPIGSPARPARDVAQGDVIDIRMPSVTRAAEARGIHPALVCLKWAVQRGQIPIPFSVNRDKYVANLRCVTEDPLSSEELAAIEADDRGIRLIKGQVFLWEGATSWEDLWDLDGTIPG